MRTERSRHRLGLGGHPAHRLDYLLHYHLFRHSLSSISAGPRQKGIYFSRAKATGHPYQKSRRNRFAQLLASHRPTSICYGPDASLCVRIREVPRAGRSPSAARWRMSACVAPTQVWANPRGYRRPTPAAAPLITSRRACRRAPSSDARHRSGGTKQRT
eukprot:355986-Chlamydomonas_euryale.AAC.1